MRALPRRAALAGLALGVALPAHAGAVLDRARHEGILRCAATERPGYATIEEDRPAGRAADLCRAIAGAALGPEGRFALRLLDLDSDFDHVRTGDVAVTFLEPRVVTEQKLAPMLVPVGEAYRDRFAVMVPAGSPPRALGDLGGEAICFMIGDPVWPLLQGGLGRRGVPFVPFGFSEEVEMKDAYNVGRCGAMAGVASTLDALRADRGVNRLRSRLLDEPLGPDTVDAMVPPADAELAAIVRDVVARRPQ